MPSAICASWCPLRALLSLLFAGLLSGAAAAEPKTGTRYGFANGCYALQTAVDPTFVRARNAGFVADARESRDAEPFYLKPAALGEYLLYTTNHQLLQAGMPASTVELSAAHEGAVWILRVQGDATAYPPPPTPDTVPDLQRLAAYRSFRDPNVTGDTFTLEVASGAGYLATAANGTVQLTPSPHGQSRFRLHALADERCARFPEAESNTTGETFSGTLEDGRVLGFADSHLHATSGTFLGGAKPGRAFHRYGVTHALKDCDEEHGDNGERDVVGALFTSDFDGHSTRGWPWFDDWPTTRATTHEATYWKWIERSWKAGLRLIMNYAVENETLCEIQRNVSGTPLRNCNEMVNAAQQVASAYALQDYVDAQYGGRGAGWWQVVTTPAQARAVIAAGKAAVLLGIEVSNLLDCRVTYNPFSEQEPAVESGDPVSDRLQP